MLYIEKGTPLRAISLKAAEIRRRKSWKQLPSSAPKDENQAKNYTNMLRFMFEEFSKEELRKTILKEQHYLCAYCMRRISNDGEHTRIEHWYPLNKSKTAAIDYNNMLGACTGLDYQDGDVHTCCDRSKEGIPITLDPRDKRMMAQIRYESNGRIYFLLSPTWSKEEIEGFQNDIDTVLMLNGVNYANAEQGQNKNQIGVDDLKSQRSAVYRACRTILDRLRRENKATEENIAAILRSIRDKEEYDEFAGVRIFYFERWLRRRRS